MKTKIAYKDPSVEINLSVEEAKVFLAFFGAMSDYEFNDKLEKAEHHSSPIKDLSYSGLMYKSLLKTLKKINEVEYKT
jgi:hypothetical protein